jgi:hypothetical protein
VITAQQNPHDLPALQMTTLSATSTKTMCTRYVLTGLRMME